MAANQEATMAANFSRRLTRLGDATGAMMTASATS